MAQFPLNAGIIVVIGVVVAGGIALARQPAAPISTTPAAMRLAQGAAPQPQIDALKVEIAQLKQQISALQNAQKTVATKGFDTAGRLSTLEKGFNGHSHHVTIIAASNTTQGWTFHTKQQQTTLATQFCKQTGPLSASNPWTCTAP